MTTFTLTLKRGIFFARWSCVLGGLVPVWERAVHLVYCACLSNCECVLHSLLVLRVGSGM